MTGSSGRRPGAPLSAFSMHTELSVRTGLFSPASAARLADITAKLLEAPA